MTGIVIVEQRGLVNKTDEYFDDGSLEKVSPSCLRRLTTTVYSRTLVSSGCFASQSMAL